MPVSRAQANRAPAFRKSGTGSIWRISMNRRTSGKHFEDDTESKAKRKKETKIKLNHDYTSLRSSFSGMG